MSKKIFFSYFVFLVFISTFCKAELSEKYATYEELVYPKILGNLDYINIQAKAGREVVFRFVKKKRTLATHPHKSMLAMAWLEILYNEMVKYPQAKHDDDVESIFNIRNQMRKSIGMSENSSTQECINRFLLMSKILSFGELETTEISEGVEKRKKLIASIQGSLGSMKSKYEENILPSKTSDDEEIINETSNQKLKNFVKELGEKSNKDDPNHKQKLKELKELYEEDLITKEEYEITKKKILDENF